MDAAQPREGGSEAPARRATRDRRGRGMRGPGVFPTEVGTPFGPTRRERFDELVLAGVGELEERWDRHLGLVEYAVEDMPLIPEDWGDDTVPLSSLVRGRGAEPTRIVLFRLPIERRCPTRAELEALVHAVLVEQVAELLDLPPETVDPRYRPDSD